MAIVRVEGVAAVELAAQARPLTLNVPQVEPVIYKRNLLEKAVCELRFPTLYGLERGKPPISLANALRKEFPEHGSVDGLNLTAGAVQQDFAYIFTDKKRHTTVTFRASALSVETTSYHSFEAFTERVLFVAEAARTAVDSEFFTRLGIRYINAVPYEQATISNWVNPVIVSPLAQNFFGQPAEYSGRIAATEERGGFLFQHGIGKHAQTGQYQYLLDFDFWREDVQFTDLKATMDQLHKMEFRLFHWSLGPAAFEYMGVAQSKK